jgi:hypothetical protein
MSRKRDPIFSVMDFFEGASLAVAQSTFSLVKRIVQKRTEAEAPPELVRRRRTKRTTASSPQPVNQAAPIVMPPPGPPPHTPTAASAVPRRRRGRTRQAAITPAAQVGELGLDLPGLGPSTVGDE